MFKCPILEELTELPMLTSQYFIDAGARVMVLRARNHIDGNCSSKTKKTHSLDRRITSDGISVNYKKSKQSQDVIRFTVKNIEPRNGLEILNAQLKEDHPTFTFYNLGFTIRMKYRGIYHTLTFIRKPSIINDSSIQSMRLMFLNGKEVNEYNFKDEELRKLCKPLRASYCSLGWGDAPQVPLCEIP